MIDRIAALGRSGLELLEALGRSGMVVFHALWAWPNLRTNFPLLVKQIYAVGVLSMVIIVVSGLFIGMVLALQGYNILNRYGSEQALGQMVALTLLRELGPVVTALLFAGRAGSALTAEIGLMKTTEQLASMEMIGVDPLRRIVSPRFWAGFICMPTLALIFSSVGVDSNTSIITRVVKMYKLTVMNHPNNTKHTKNIIQVLGSSPPLEPIIL